MRIFLPNISARAAFVVAAALAGLALSFPRTALAQRLPTTVIPTHYTLKLTPDLKAATFSGEEAIDVNILRAHALHHSERHRDRLPVSDHLPQRRRSRPARSASIPEKQQATFTFPKTVPAGNATIKIRYNGILNNELRGFYLSKTARRNYAVTQFESTDARRAFPCFDEPAFKATYDISLVVDARDTAISNEPHRGRHARPRNNKHTLNSPPRRRCPPISSLSSWATSHCTGGRQDDVDLRVCATPDKVALTPYALGVAKYVLHYYDDYFGIHYPLTKLDLIAIPDFEAGAMENFGAITFRETDLLLDPEIDPLAVKEKVALVVAHEMSHQWFGDLVTMQWWDNIWLNEGFATWMENKPVAAMHPEWNIPQVVARDEQDTLDVDAQPTTRAIRARADTPEEIDQMFDDIAYGKASDVLLMVENYLGEEIFRKGVHAYLAAHAYGNATAEDFWNAQTAVSHKPVDKIIESLVVQPGAPILSFGTPADGKVSVEQKRFFLSPSIELNREQNWTLPVCFKTADAADCELLTPETSSLKAPAAGLFFANAGSEGYYRSSYAPAQSAALVADAESGLTPPERISLTGDEWAQVRANKATVGNYLDLVAALKDDPNAEVLKNALRNVGTIADRLTSSKEERDALAAWVRREFAPAYAKLGPPEPGDSPNTRELRAQLFSLLADRGNGTDLIAEARKIADQYLSNPSSVDPTLCHAALEVAAEFGDAALFDQWSTCTRPRMIPICRRLRCACWSSLTTPPSSSAPSNTRFRATCATRMRRFSSPSVFKLPKTAMRRGASSRRTGIRSMRR